MSIVERSRARLINLYDESQYLRRGDSNGQVLIGNMPLCSAWLTATQNLVHQLVASPENPYRKKIDRIAEADHGYAVNDAVGELGEVLLNMARDVDNGLIAGIVSSAQAEVFDDFIEHATQYLKANKKQQAGVIAGVVFEDSLRRLCRKHQIPEPGVPLDALITSLEKAGHLTSVQAKRARAAAGLRTSATHAQWDEFQPDDVRSVIEYTKELIRTKLDG
jgi:hypothetical protein